MNVEKPWKSEAKWRSTLSDDVLRKVYLFFAIVEPPPSRSSSMLLCRTRILPGPEFDDQNSISFFVLSDSGAETRQPGDVAISGNKSRSRHPELVEFKVSGTASARVQSTSSVQSHGRASRKCKTVGFECTDQSMRTSTWAEWARNPRGRRMDRPWEPGTRLRTRESPADSPACTKN